jgi:hypothetical protein
MPAALMIGHHFSISVFGKAPSAFYLLFSREKMLGKVCEPRTQLGID